MDVNLLKKFYRGKCSEEEAQRVISWFSSKEEKESLLEQLQSTWEQFEEPEDEALLGYHSTNTLQAIQSRIRKEESLAEGDKNVRYLNINRYYNTKIAAIILLAVGISFIMQILLQSAPVEVSQLLVSEAPAGQKRTIVLSDGTKITLNAGSKIFYPEQFSDGGREVALEGEAFFEVARDTLRPFTVATDQISTRVLGTSFNIKAYRDEQIIQVAVASGKVKVSQNFSKKEYYLLPGKAVSYHAEDQSIQVADFNKREVLAWKDGMLYFKDASYQDVEKALERWYGIEIQVKGDIKQEWQYSGSFQQESLENVLKSIGYVQQFSHQRTGNQVVLRFNK